MSIGTNTPRLLAAAKEFNIGKETLLKFLEEKGFDTTKFKPNTKLSEEMYNALQEEYAKSKVVKEKSDAIDLPKGSLMDNIDKTEAELDLSAKDKKPEVVEELPKENMPLSPAKPSPEQPEQEETSDTKGQREEKEAPTAKEEEQTDIPQEEKEEPITPATLPTKEEESESTPAVAEEEVIPVDEKEEDLTPAPKEEDVDNQEAPAGQEEEKKLKGPKVLDKINLDDLNLSTRPKKSSPKKKAEKEKTKVSAKKEEEKAASAPKKEEESVANQKSKEQVVAATKPVEEVQEHIETKTPKLEGPRVVGKIELPTRPERSRGDSKEKKKRKRIPIDQKHKKPRFETDASKGGFRKGAKGRDRFGKRGLGNTPQEIDAKEIQEKIKETQAKLAGGGARNRNLKAKYRRNKREERAERRRMAAEELAHEDNVIQVTEFISVSELANLLEVNFAEVISKCMSLGIMVSINQRLDAEVIELVASEFDTEVEFIDLEDHSDEEDDDEDEDEENLEARAPVVTIMGHVDHGKTSLLDYIRSASVVTGEAGGITQHIGAYKVKTSSGKELAFLDTPGHEAFTAMRARGAKAADVAIIVIAADDAIMPQTREAISHAQAADLPMVFAINKIDKETANPNKIKEQLSAMNILIEEWGGKYQCQEISAKKGININELLEKVLLEAEMQELKANPNRNAKGTIIEASLDKGRGYVTTVLVQTGTLHKGEMIVAGQYYGKVKAMNNERGQNISQAGPSTPVQILGLNGAPKAGEKFKVFEDESEAKSLANHRAQILREQGLRSRKHITLDEIGRRLALGNFQELNVIIKADFDGSAEALSDSLQKLSTEEIVVNVVMKGVGQISESDVMLASASDAIIIGFQVRPSAHAAQLAEEENIEIRHYSIIYDATEEIKSAMEGMLQPTIEKKIVANVEVREIFKISKVGTIAGCYVLDGKMTRNTKINIIRDGIVVHTGELASLKRFKDDVKEVAAGYECGLNIKGYNDIQIGDILEGYEEVEIKRTL